MNPPKTCQCCGQIIPRELILPPIKQRIYDALRKRPRTTDELRRIAGIYHPSREWVNDNIIYNHISQLRKILLKYGETIPKKLPWEDLYRLAAL